MKYNTEVFEKAAQEKGYIIESIKKIESNSVESMKGTIILGTNIRQVWWNKEGKCFSYKRNPLPKYDLPLEDIQKQITSNHKEEGV